MIISEHFNYQPDIHASFTLQKGGNQYSVILENGDIEIFNHQNHRLAQSTVYKLLRTCFVDNFNYNSGTLSWSNTDILFSQETNPNELIADYSFNPLEIADAWLSEKHGILDEIGYKNTILSEYIGFVSRSSFINNGDKNLITTAIEKRYLRKHATPLDLIAMEASEIANITIEEQDIVEFITTYPSGVPKNNELTRKLSLKFKELTGMSLQHRPYLFSVMHHKDTNAIQSLDNSPF